MSIITPEQNLEILKCVGELVEAHIKKYRDERLWEKDLHAWYVGVAHKAFNIPLVQLSTNESVSIKHNTEAKIARELRELAGKQKSENKKGHTSAHLDTAVLDDSKDKKLILGNEIKCAAGHRMVGDDSKFSMTQVHKDFLVILSNHFIDSPSLDAPPTSYCVFFNINKNGSHFISHLKMKDGAKEFYLNSFRKWFFKKRSKKTIPTEILNNWATYERIFAKENDRLLGGFLIWIDPVS